MIAVVNARVDGTPAEFNAIARELRRLGTTFTISGNPDERVRHVLARREDVVLPVLGNSTVSGEMLLSSLRRWEVPSKEVCDAV